MVVGHKKYFSSIEWSLRADMVHLCKLVTDVRFDLDDYARDDFFQGIHNGFISFDGDERFFIKATYRRKYVIRKLKRRYI